MRDPKIYLEKDKLLHADMLDALKSEKTEVLASEEDGVLLRCAEGIYTLSAESEETFRKLCRLIPEKNGIEACTHQMKFAPLLPEGREKMKILPCWEFSVWNEKKLPENEVSGIEFRPITEEYLPFIDENYSESADYIRRCLKKGMIGAFEGERCVGFVGLHPNGEVGLLKVLPAYRNRRIGTGLEVRIINRQIGEGHIPFNFVVIGNDVSISLQQRLGLQKAEHMVAWMMDDKD